MAAAEAAAAAAAAAEAEAAAVTQKWPEAPGDHCPVCCRAIEAFVAYSCL